MGAHTTLAITLSIVAWTVAANAADGELGKGTRVRLTLEEDARTVVGRVEQETDDAIVVRTGSQRRPVERVPLSSVRSVEVALHRRYGAGVGIAAGSAVGAVAALRGGGSGSGALGGALFALPGAFVSSAVVGRGGSLGRGIAAGTVSSAALGTGLGLLASGGNGWFSGPEMIAVGAVAGVVFGAVSSTAASVASRPRWQRVERKRDHVCVGVTPVRAGMAAQVQIAF